MHVFMFVQWELSVSVNNIDDGGEDIAMSESRLVP